MSPLQPPVPKVGIGSYPTDGQKEIRYSLGDRHHPELFYSIGLSPEESLHLLSNRLHLLSDRFHCVGNDRHPLGNCLYFLTEGRDSMWTPCRRGVFNIFS